MAESIAVSSKQHGTSVEPPAELPISQTDWEATPAAVRAVVVWLWQQVQELRAQIELLQGENASLREQLGQNSSNSSKPPSSDPPNTPPRPARTPSGRKVGGQPGHAGHGRCLKPPQQVNRMVDAKPLACEACGALLLGEDAHPARHQTTELPRIEPQVVEYRRHTLRCVACGARTQGEWPPEMPRGSFEPRMQATVGYFTGRLGVSQRDVEEAMETLFHAEMSLGSVSTLEEAVSEALAEPVAEAREYVQHQPTVNVDETGWKERAQPVWLWVATTSLVTAFCVMATRGKEGAKKLLGEGYAGIVGSDRLSAYNWLDVLRRQLCWAHLLRNFQAFVDRGDESARIGEALLAQGERLFKLWYRVRDGTLTRPEFQKAMEPVRQEVGDRLREGATLSHAKTRRTCQNILQWEGALWTFVFVEGVEPTNNAAERALRRGVLWRRRSFGTQSENGSRFVERVLTTVTTLRQQKRDVLDYLAEACAAALRGATLPSLLPNPVAVTHD